MQRQVKQTIPHVSVSGEKSVVFWLLALWYFWALSLEEAAFLFPNSVDLELWSPQLCTVWSLNRERNSQIKKGGNLLLSTYCIVCIHLVWVPCFFLDALNMQDFEALFLPISYTELSIGKKLFLTLSLCRDFVFSTSISNIFKMKSLLIEPGWFLFLSQNLIHS